MGGDWYYNKNGQQLGPVNFDQLKDLAATGQLIASDMVWRHGMGHWTRAGIVKGVFGGDASTAGSALAPPLPVGTQVITPTGTATPPPMQYQQPMVTSPMNPGSQPGIFQGSYDGAIPGAAATLEYVTAASARAGSALAGFPPGTGSRDEWPLSPQQLAQLQLAEKDRKPIRNLAGLLRMLFLLCIIGLVCLLLAAAGGGFGFGRRSSSDDAVVFWFVMGMLTGFCTLFFFAGRASMKCQSWGALVLIALSSLWIALNIVAAVMNAGEDAIIGFAALGSIIPLLILISSIQAYTAMSRFLASPLWCQEALVSAKL
jgi:hypothetical protein